ncbi:redoxin [Bifidobacterium sp. DSM 109958]|uniref:thioredoxin-dependent peroxiredoxin n=1 Tax=Bifidobacterium moraviense TaxID=2675323 RepID=A0A7Y0F2N4_9BIFI|nr:peroxiredoxin [Bifidobacterium sp. DSM 109958]NMN00929.1 redoxin [Bifidobacterium sp. DSM 109958]
MSSTEPNTAISHPDHPETELPRRLEAGETAPDFVLPAVVPAQSDGTDDAAQSDATQRHADREVSLSEVLAQGRRVVLYFYPAAMTPGCTTEACDFRDNLNRLSAAGVTVLGVSKDPLARLRRFAERDHLTFPLLSDPDLALHRAYGAWGEKKLYGKVHVGVIRSTFVIEPDGRIAIARYNVRAKGHVASLMKALDLA